MQELEISDINKQLPNIIGSSPKILNLKKTILQAAPFEYAHIWIKGSRERKRIYCQGNSREQW